MKYYLYISDAKVDMFHAQIHKNWLKRIVSELSISLKLVSTEISATMKSDQSEITRYSRLKRVVKYIEKHMSVGTVDDPKAYFKGTLPMQWGPLKNSATVYFGGSTNHTIMGMGGSLQHVIGNTYALPTQGILPGTPIPLSDLLDALAQEAQADTARHWIFPASKDSSIPKYTLDVVRTVTTNMVGPQQKLEFLAKTLAHGPARSSQVLLGAPIYVALAD